MDENLDQIISIIMIDQGNIWSIYLYICIYMFNGNRITVKQQYKIHKIIRDYSEWNSKLSGLGC